VHVHAISPGVTGISFYITVFSGGRFIEELRIAPNNWKKTNVHVHAISPGVAGSVRRLVPLLERRLLVSFL